MNRLRLNIRLKRKRSRVNAMELYDGAEGQNFMRLRRTSCRHGDFRPGFWKFI